MKRETLMAKRNPLVFKVRLAQNIIIGLFTGVIYYQLTDGKNDPTNLADIVNINGCLFFITMTSFMSSLNPAVLTFLPQRAVFMREENSKLYSVGSYFFG